MSTALGINVGTALMHIDYTRWYITLLLTFYLLFGITLTFARGKRASMVLLLLGIAVVALRIPKLFPFGTIDQILAFPLGCLFVSYESSLKTRLKEQAWSRTKGFTMTCLAMGFLSVICLVLGEAVTFGQKMAFSVIQSANGLLVCVFIVLLIDIFSRKGYKSKFLAFCGTISYELYLIHGPFLIKYNPVFGFFSAWAIAVAFLLLLVALMASSYGYHLINRWVTGKLLGNPALFGSK
jgi:peptidoglycan/LPS O-acetylase OafA/YrhL